MPIYEYRCASCNTTFEKLRPMSQANTPAICVCCGSPETMRAISVFAAISRSKGGESHPVSGTDGGCASCGSHNCGTCSH